MKRACLLVLVLGCASSGPSLDRASLAQVTYGVPAGWSSMDLSTHSRAMIEWTPSENDRKESITIIRTERPGLAKHSGGLGRLLIEANEQLPKSWFAAPRRVSTKSGLTGARIEGVFTPRDQSTPYQRIHAVLANDKHLLHVIYTGHELDREVFEAVVDSFQGV